MASLSEKILTLGPCQDPTVRHWYGYGANKGQNDVANNLLHMLRRATTLEEKAHIPLVRYIHGIMFHGSDERVEAWKHALRLGVSPNLHVPYGSGVDSFACPGGPAYFFAGNVAEFEPFLAAGANMKALDDFSASYDTRVRFKPGEGNNALFNLSYSVDLRPRLEAHYEATGENKPNTGIRAAPVRVRWLR